MSERIPDEVEGVLLAAGWRPGRMVDVEPCLMAWRSLSLAAESAPTEFVAEFDNLLLRHPPIIDVGGAQHCDHTRFDVVQSVRGVASRAHREYSILAETDLYPVGENRSHMTLMIGACGKMFAGVDNYLLVYPGVLESALVYICRGFPPRPLGEWSL
ncbi:SUKH-3 domain-containing protein [Crossiella sp. NPDC003009]